MKYKLPKEFADAWLEALESGEYEQARAGLFVIHDLKKSYCCLGVAGKVVGLPDSVMKGRGCFTAWYAERLADNHPEILLYPSELIGDVDDDLMGELIDMNDDYGKSFKQIAAWVRENVELY